MLTGFHMLQIISAIGVMLGIALLVLFFISSMKTSCGDSLALFFCGFFMTTLSANIYNYVSEKIKCETKENVALVQKTDEVHQKFLNTVNDDPDFKIYFEH